MVLEATVFCLDNSEWMRNGDYTPTRLEAQQDAVNLLSGVKTQSNPESTVAVMTCAGRSPEVLVTLTTDIGKILSSLHQVKINGELDFLSGIQVAQLVLKHRQNKNQHQRIIFFVGSPIKATKEELVRLGKRLKKNNIAVDVVNFGEESQNTEKLEDFINAVNKENNSHLVSIPPGPHILSDILISSEIVNEGGSSGTSAADLADYGGVDPNLDPELALALKISMEEARQEAEKKKGEESKTETKEVKMEDVKPTQSQSTPMEIDEEDEELKLALQMSMSSPQQTTSSSSKEEKKESSEDVSRVLNDPDFVSSVLSNLPGVDKESDRIKNALADILEKKDEKDKNDKSKK